MSKDMWKDTHQRFSLGMLLVVILIVTINTSFLVEIKVTIHIQKILTNSNYPCARKKRVQEEQCKNM
jgi:hypothetical protein